MQPSIPEKRKILQLFIIVPLIISIALFPLSGAFAATKTNSENTAATSASTQKSSSQSTAAATEGKKAETEKIQKAKDAYTAKEEEYKKANGSVTAINTQIEKLESTIINTITNIQDLQKEIDKRQVAVDKMYNNFKGRLKSIYMSGSYTDIQALLTADTFADYLTKSQMIKSVSKKDKATIEEMKKAYAGLEKKKKEIENKRIKLELQEASLQTSKSKLELKKAEAAKAYNASIELLKKVDDSTKATKAQIEHEQKELTKIISMCKKEAEISKDIASALKSGNDDLKSEIVSNGGLLCFPVPQCRNVSCGFYGYTNHNGMDFSDSNVYGKKVVAAADGKIMDVQLLDYSYGHHIWINHGKNVATLYAHLSRVVVKKGQYVKQGQVIGYVGSTGNSTGPHLHFGLLINGTFENPINYF